MGPELEAMVRRIGDGAAARVLDALEEHGDAILSDARAVWPVWTGASRDGLRAVTTISSDAVKLRITNEATKQDQVARLKTGAEPKGKSRSHYAEWQAAQTRKSASVEQYGYMVGKPNAWKRLVLDPAREAESALIDRVGDDLRKLAEE